jgi:hypothetical protein
VTCNGTLVRRNPVAAHNTDDTNTYPFEPCPEDDNSQTALEPTLSKDGIPGNTSDGSD